MPNGIDGPTLDDLPSIKFYQKLNEDNDIEKYYGYCDYVKSIYGDRSNEHTFCAKMVKNFKILDDIPIDEEFSYIRCDYLNYWVYDRAIDKFNISDTNISYSSTILYLLYPWDNIYNGYSISNKCWKKNFQISVQEFKEQKKNFDDSQNYIYIKNIINSGAYKQYNAFFQYITETDSLHSSIKNECTCDKDNALCFEFHKYNKESGKDHLCSIECKPEKPSAGLPEKSKRVCSLTQHIGEEPPTQPVVQITVKDNDGDAPTPTSSPLVIPISTLFTVSGISLFLLFLFKFTPFRSWLRPRMRWLSRSVNNLEEEEAQEMLYTSLNEQINMEDKTYHISYPSADIS
ncbi:PIR protein [Plasmodium ovale]|uniref:PIR protein n=1 Tax=Plasmodium ovale TaxID=36330 RepID=A0A1C3KGA3_PLAOA|nr:PIR protein [Plasmodium ovale]